MRPRRSGLDDKSQGGASGLLLPRRAPWRVRDTWSQGIWQKLLAGAGPPTSLGLGFPIYMVEERTP